jgi:putative glycosyltransferase (TIGR04348 family)
LQKPHIIIISPALANANNGNWQTASRWATFLRAQYRVSLAPDWTAATAAAAPDAMIALHARRSAESIAQCAAACPGLPLLLVLTGTDLYRDIRTDAAAQHSLRLATRLVVLQEAGLQELPPELRAKTSVIYQSARALKAAPGAGRRGGFEVVMIGHLRDEKHPQTFMQAAALLASQPIRFTHIGAALDPALGAQAQATQARHACYHWLGNLPHAKTLRLLAASDLMVIASKMEGGANVIVEALVSGVPVLASDISGNRGMLGDDYAGYFPVGDSQALARLIECAAHDPGFAARLRAQCAARAPLFAPQREKQALLQLMNTMLTSNQECS